MSEREKLIEILNDFFGCDAAYYGINPQDLAIHLIENGVRSVDAVKVPPIKLGDKAFFIINGQIFETEICVIQWYAHRYGGVVDEIRGDTPGGSVGAPFSEWGKTVFATKEEAEKVLYPYDNCFCGTYRSCEGCSYGERKDND